MLALSSPHCHCCCCCCCCYYCLLLLLLLRTVDVKFISLDATLNMPATHQEGRPTHLPFASAQRLKRNSESNASALNSAGEASAVQAKPRPPQPAGSLQPKRALQRDTDTEHCKHRTPLRPRSSLRCHMLPPQRNRACVACMVACGGLWRPATCLSDTRQPGSVLAVRMLGWHPELSMSSSASDCTTVASWSREGLKPSNHCQEAC